MRTKTKSINVAAIAAGLVGVALVQAQPGLVQSQPGATQPSTQPTMDQKQTASYGIGYYMMGRQIKESGVAFDVDLLVQGIRDAMAAGPSKVGQEQFQTAMATVEQEMAANAAASGNKNVEAGTAFRADNGKKTGVKTTATGLQIESIKEGTGASPTAADKVKVHYKGTLINGQQFDSSYDRGQPIEFPLNGVIAGWTEGLQLMKVGGKSRLVIPPEIGYGERGSAGSIPPNSTLVFEVELLDIVK